MKTLWLREVKGPSHRPTRGRPQVSWLTGQGSFAMETLQSGPPTHLGPPDEESAAGIRYSWEGGQNPSFLSGCSKEPRVGSGRLKPKALPTPTATGN